MQAVTEEEMRAFLARHKGLRCEEAELHFDSTTAKTILVDFRNLQPQQLVYLARLVAHLRYEELDFFCASLWITNRRTDDRVAAVVFKSIERMRQGYGENRSLDRAVGHFFRHDEFVESISFLVQPMLAGWDAYFVPQWSWGTLDYFVFVNNDSFFEIKTRTEEMYSAALTILKNHNWINLMETRY